MRPQPSTRGSHRRECETGSAAYALEALAGESPVKAELVKLRYFCGLSHREAAASLGLSRATADRYWAYAKAFLFTALQDGPG